MNLRNHMPQLIPMLVLNYKCMKKEFQGNPEYYQLDDEYIIFYDQKHFNVANQKGKLYLIKIQQIIQICLLSPRKFEANELKIIDLKTQKTILTKSDNTKITNHIFTFRFNCETLILISDLELQFFNFDGQKRSQAIRIKDQEINEVVIVNSSFVIFATIIDMHLLNFFLIYMKNGKCCKFFFRKRYNNQTNRLNKLIFVLYHRSFQLKQFNFCLMNLQGKIFRMLKQSCDEIFENAFKTSFINNEYYIFTKESYLKGYLIKGVFMLFEFSLGNYRTSTLPLSQPIFISTDAETINPSSEKINVKASLFKFEV